MFNTVVEMVLCVNVDRLPVEKKLIRMSLSTSKTLQTEFWIRIWATVIFKSNDNEYGHWSLVLYEKVLPNTVNPEN